MYFKGFPDDCNIQSSALVGEQLYHQRRCTVINTGRETGVPSCGAGVLISSREDLERSYWSLDLYLFQRGLFLLFNTSLLLSYLSCILENNRCERKGKRIPGSMCQGTWGKDISVYREFRVV